MSRASLFAVAFGGFVVLGWSGEAAAQYWKINPPTARSTPGVRQWWSQLWEKGGVPWLEGQWQYECAQSRRPYYGDTGRRFLAVWVSNPGWTIVRCFGEGEERTVRSGGGTGYGSQLPGNIGVITCPGHPLCRR